MRAGEQKEPVESAEGSKEGRKTKVKKSRKRRRKGKEKEGKKICWDKGHRLM